MGRVKGGVRDNIRRAARRLFYEQGYPRVGISELVEAAGTNKASFYYNYASKEELGREYLRDYSDFLLERVKRIAARSPDPADFFRRWARLMKRDMELSPGFNGCPVANFMGQVPRGDPHFGPEMQRITQEWRETLIEYFTRCRETGALPASKDPAALAELSLCAYQGGLWLWKAIEKKRAFQRMEEMFLALLA
jgi:AcrR family transcriptional regulator